MQEKLKVKIKKLHPDAVIPKYAHDTDAGLDLSATSKVEELTYIEYGTSLAFDIPEGYVGLIFPRSSLSKKNLLLTNHVGVIDSRFFGEVKFRFKKVDKDRLGLDYEYNVGDRIGQLIIMPYPKIEFEEVEELGQSKRGTGAFGSTGS